MNDDFDGPRISPAEFLSERPERNQRAATEPMVPGPSFIHPGFWWVFAILGLSIGNYMRLPVATAVFRPEKKPRFSASWPQMKGGVLMELRA